MELSKYIDHTILKPDATKAEIKLICDEAKEYGFFSVCVNSSNVPFVKKELKGTEVKVTAVVGFPLGAMTIEAKAFETKDAVAKGADEIDMVINIGALKDRDLDYLKKDIQAIVEACEGRAIVKVIIETSLLKDEEKILACQAALQAGADYVKTSTGFNGGGATVEDVQLMKKVVGEKLKVKASGGIRDYDMAIKMLSAGASRLGCSASVTIVKGDKNNEAKQNDNY